MKPPLLLRALLPAVLLSCGLLTTGCHAESKTKAAASAAAAPASGWKVALQSTAWKATGFEGNMDLSGIAAVDAVHCLLGSDELLGVQPGLLDRKGMTIRALPVIPLVANPSGAKGEVDVEGVAVSPADHCYYVTGSHGVGKKKGEYDPTRASVFKLPCDPQTGEITGKGIQHASLMPWLERSMEFGAFAKQPLQQNGFNIEGLAFKDGRLWFGVRGPNVDGHTFVIEVEPDSLFEGGLPACKVHTLPVGEGRGIRELAAVREGFVVLTGNAGAEASKKFPVSVSRMPDASFDLFLWRPGKTPETQSIGQLPSPSAKAEALLVLEDSEKYVDLLVLFDGAPDGAPRSYRLTRP
ncbi:MAG: hypothetical protein JWM59_1617 [Verrucomicrobiales bacterium]|nr:hypothetical protein [Verrucomicrobiales bacterium]